MKKLYHFFYRLDVFDTGNSEPVDSDSFFFEDDIFDDVIAFLDQYDFDVRRSVVKKLVEFAGEQFNDR